MNSMGVNALDNKILTVVWLRSAADAMLTQHYISNVILSRVGVPVRHKFIEDISEFPMIDNVLIINMTQNMSLISEFVADRGCKNVGVLAACHTGGEYMDYYPKVDYVLRIHFSPSQMVVPEGARCFNISWIPLGYKTGTGPRNRESLLPFEHREIEFFFSGAPDTNYGERLSMISAVKESNLPVWMNITKGFSQGLSVNHYRGMMENAKFALIPGGTDAETIRLFEALELGCIPISLDHAFLNDDRAMGGSPVVRLQSWAELPLWYDRVKSSSNYLSVMEIYRLQVSEWWHAFKIKQADKVGEIIRHSFSLNS